MSAATTLAPSSTNFLVHARPKPDAAPEGPEKRKRRENVSTPFPRVYAVTGVFKKSGKGGAWILGFNGDGDGDGGVMDILVRTCDNGHFASEST